MIDSNKQATKKLLKKVGASRMKEVRRDDILTGVALTAGVLSAVGNVYYSREIFSPGYNAYLKDPS